MKWRGRGREMMVSSIHQPINPSTHQSIYCVGSIFSTPDASLVQPCEKECKAEVVRAR